MCAQWTDDGNKQALNDNNNIINHISPFTQEGNALLQRYRRSHAQKERSRRKIECVRKQSVHVTATYLYIPFSKTKRIKSFSCDNSEKITVVYKVIIETWSLRQQRVKEIETSQGDRCRGLRNMRNTGSRLR